jgi:hypothetical protein
MPRSAIIWTRSRKLSLNVMYQSHTQNDDLLVKVPSLEQILCRGRFRHPGSYREDTEPFNSLHQNRVESIAYQAVAERGAPMQ